MKKEEGKKPARVKVTKANAKSHYAGVIRAIGSGKLPATSGEFIRAKLVQGKLDTNGIVAEVKKRYKGSKVAPSDVYWNRGRLKREGIKLAA